MSEIRGAVEYPPFEGVFEYPVSGNNFTLRAISFFAVTDYHDTLTSEKRVNMFASAIPKQTGNIFILEDPLKDEAILFISLSPDHVKATFEVKDGKAFLDNGSYGVAVGKCRISDVEAFCRAWYRGKCKPSPLFTLANTWGDGNAWNRVRADFIEKEIDACSEIGVDALQIDDGWQTGETSDPSRKDERNRRTFYGDFWELSKERFPDGMEPIRDRAKEKGVTLGLWFAPHYKHSFELAERDAAILRNAYKNWGMRCFKFDMLYIDEKKDYDAFVNFLDDIYSFGEGVSVQLDVTNGLRGGYLSLGKYGSIFVENRFTFKGNAYPHRAMRNLWDMCRFIPAYKFQFELVNPDLNPDKYPENDALSPIYFDMDFLFAAVMVSNPLFWMETQFLSEARRKELGRILPVWKEIRKELAEYDVIPIGGRPDGASFTGFEARSADGKKAYLALFRFINGEDTHKFEIKTKAKSIKLLASNTDISAVPDGSGISVTFGKERSYALFEIEA